MTKQLRSLAPAAADRGRGSRRSYPEAALPLLCAASCSQRQSKTRRAARRDARRFSSGQGCPV
ncbi:hypothetical protein GLA29479_161 [Lysobacter antibioticus]|nr:hypothetical protein GLA29479_161 [Lysobacter antibioticus]